MISKIHGRRIVSRSRIRLHGLRDDDMEMEREREQEPKFRPRPWREPPTETAFDMLGPRSIPAKPKIVVLGATGRTGRHVIKKLLDIGIEMEIVAIVRDLDKAIRVLCEEEALVRVKGPKLTIVQGDLVPPEELPGFDPDKEEDEIRWRETAKSAADFYNNSVDDYDNREMAPDINESLQDAIRDCTTIISCVASVRRTHIWHDVVARPFFRLLKADVSSWCKDGRHPFYVNFVSTRKALGYAEREQVRREAAVATMAEEQGLDPEEIFVPRIRFIRISNLCVTYRPWHIESLVANSVNSIAFRYQEMTEQLLEDSSSVETVILRPGDLTDEERSIDETHVQVSSSGKVQSPATIGRKDVASLVVAAATFVTKKNKSASRYDSISSKGGSRTCEPFHYTFGCRWVGYSSRYSSPQGNKRDGHRSPADAFRRSLKKLHGKERGMEQKKLFKKEGSQTKQNQLPSVIRMAQQIRKRRKKRRKLKPYALYTIPCIYISLLLFAKITLVPILQQIPGYNEWINPCLNRARQTLALGFSSLFHQAHSLLFRIRQMQKTNYIRF